MLLKLDENLGRSAAALLGQAGHDVATVAGQGLCSATDREIIRVCTSEGRCLVTLDLDFADPVAFPPHLHAGVAVLPLPRKPDPGSLVDLLATLAAALASRPIGGKLWIVERGRVREHEPKGSPS